MRTTHLLVRLAVALALGGCNFAAVPFVPCGTCAIGEVCDPLTARCVPANPDGGAATACTRDSACASPTPRCLVAERRCVGCLDTADCAAGTCDPVANTCVPVSDACSSARLLDLTSGHATVYGDTSRAADDTRLSCAAQGSSGADVVYAFTVTEVRKLTAAVHSDSAGFRPVLAVRSACDDASTEPTLGCSFTPTGAAATGLTVDGLAPGTYFVWVDGEGPVGGAFTLELSLEPASRVDTCDAPVELRPGTGSVTVTGDTTPLHDDVAAACGGLSSPDAIYALRLDAERRVRVEVQGAGRFRPTVYLRPTCAAGPELACVRADAAGAAVFELPRVPAGDTFLVVDGTAAAPAGRYRLTVTTGEPIAPPTNDTCATAAPLPVPAGELGSVAVTGDTVGARGDALGGCGGPALGPDVVYSLTLTAPREVTVRVSPLAGSPSMPVVYLRRPGACGSDLPADQVACAAASLPGYPAAFVVPRLGPGTWSLWVDGPAATSAGAFDLLVELAPPPAPPLNDGCSDAGLIGLGAGPVTVSGTTLGATPDTQGCGGGPDVVYSLQVPTHQAVALDLRAAPGSLLQPVAALRPDGVCAATLALPPLACVPPDPLLTDRTTLTLPDLAPGSYALWINGLAGTQGAFSLRLSPSAPLAAPSNDACGTGPVSQLSVNVPAQGDSRAAHDDSAGQCGATTPGLSGDGAPDVFYVFSLSTPRQVSVTVTPDPVDGALLRPVVYVKGPATACTATGPTVGCDAAPGYGQPVTLTLPALAAGVWTLWVDGAGTSSGRFSVLLQ